MTSELREIRLADDLSLPWNLTEWIEPRQLQEWIAEEISSLDWNDPQVVDYVRRHTGLQPRVLLCLITYAYATSTFASDDIVDKCEEDPTYRDLCHGYAPKDGAIVSRFRRENQGLLKWALLQVLKRAVRVRLSENFIPPGLKRQLANAAGARLRFARQFDRETEGF